MIKVQFKNTYENIYNGREYYYKDFDGVEVGDIVVVNTRSGYAIARVSDTNCTNFVGDTDRLATVEKIVITKKELDEKERLEKEKQVRINDFVNEAKRKALLGHLSGFTTDEAFLKELASLSLVELETISNLLSM